MRIANKTLEVLKAKEGNASLAGKGKIHPKTDSTYGAYYDSRGYLTTGYGILISKNRKGSKQEAADIKAWKEKHPDIDPFTLDETKATDLLRAETEEHLGRLKNHKELKDLDPGLLNDGTQAALASIVFNLGSIGPDTASALAKAVASKKTEDWEALASEIEVYHGGKSKDQEKAVLERRRDEANMIREAWSIPKKKYEPLKEWRGKKPDKADKVSAVNLLDDSVSVVTREPASQVGAPVIEQGFTPAPTQDVDINDPLAVKAELEQPLFQNARSPSLTDINAQKLEKEKASSAFPTLSESREFLANAFVTNNVVGSTIKKFIMDWDTDKTYVENYNPASSVLYSDLTKKVKTEDLEDFLDGVQNDEHFAAKSAQYETDLEAQEATGEFFQKNPVLGTVGLLGVGLSDVTNLIPVGKAGQLLGMPALFKSAPAVLRTIGAQISENIVQELMQETILTQNSEVRKWDDYDVTIGLTGALVLGGGAGYLRHINDTHKMTKIISQAAAEKNMDQLQFMLNHAKENNLDPVIVRNLEQGLEYANSELKKTVDAQAVAVIGEEQIKVGRGLVEQKETELLLRQSELEVKADKEIATIKNNLVKDVDNRIKDAKQSAQAQVNSLKANNKELKREISKLEKKIKPYHKELPEGLKELRNKLRANETKIKNALDSASPITKKLRAEKDALVRRIQKMGDEFSTPEIDTIKRNVLESRDNAVREFTDFEQKVLSGKHPVLESMLEEAGFTKARLAEIGLPNSGTLDDLDNSIGLSFSDSPKSLSSAGFREGPMSDFIERQNLSTVLGTNVSMELRQFVATSAFEALMNPTVGLTTHQMSKNSTYAQILRATRLSQLMNTNTAMGHFILNKNALRHSDNPIARALYNKLAPDLAGRVAEGNFSMAERSAQIANTFGGVRLRAVAAEKVSQIDKLCKTNPQLRAALDIGENPALAFMQKSDVGFQAKVSDMILKAELMAPGSLRAHYGDAVGKVAEEWADSYRGVTRDILKLAADKGVLGADEILAEASDPNWFVRRWDNNRARQFDVKYGSDKLRELIRKGMVQAFEKEGLEITEGLSKMIDSRTKAFRLGITEVDLHNSQINHFADIEEFVENIIARKGEVTNDILIDEVDRLARIKQNNAAREMGRRTMLDLSAEIDIDGQKVSLAGLLESNLVRSTEDYVKRMGARITAAENGLPDINDLDVMVQKAEAFELQRANKSQAEYVKQVMSDDVAAFKSGSTTAPLRGGTEASRTITRLLMKYNTSRLMHHTGISAIGEAGGVIPQAGYKAVYQAVAQEFPTFVRHIMLGGVSGKQLSTALSDELGALTGVGFEDFNFDSLWSSSHLATTSRVGNMVEKGIDNSLKLMGKSTRHIETTIRRGTINALGISMGNAALGRKSVGGLSTGLFGGLSKQNMLEIGLGELVDGKIVINKKWDNISDMVRKFAIDEDGKLAAESGKTIKNFNVGKWDEKTKQDFAQALILWSNKILVNPDPTTAKAWNNSLLGTVFNQFKTFSMNATSKVAGHNVNAAVLGMRHGDASEAAKTIQTYFWSAIMGKLAWASYGAIDNAGREDFSERMERYLSVSEPRDWTRALGRSSAITGFDVLIDSGVGVYASITDEEVEPFFDVSTVGRSRNQFDLKTTATGQLITGTTEVAQKTAQGEFKEAGSKAVKLSPWRKAMGINQMLNAMGVD